MLQAFYFLFTLFFTNAVNSLHIVKPTLRQHRVPENLSYVEDTALPASEHLMEIVTDVLSLLYSCNTGIKSFPFVFHDRMFLSLFPVGLVPVALVISDELSSKQIVISYSGLVQSFLYYAIKFRNFVLNTVNEESPQKSQETRLCIDGASQIPKTGYGAMCYLII